MEGVTAAEFGSFFLSLVVPIITGVAAAGFTAYLALRRFYKEKWWEKKHSAYNQLIDDLIEVKSFYGQALYYYDIINNAGKNDKAPKWSLDWKRFNELNRKLQRSYSLAPISSSKNTRKLLYSFFEKQDLVEHSIGVERYPEEAVYSDMIAATEAIIDAIVLDAEKELKFM